MECQNARNLILRFDLSRADRSDLLQALRHVEQCAECGSATVDYDQIRELLHSGDAEADAPAEPAGGWTSFEDRLASQVSAPRRSLRLMPVALAACVALAALGWSLHLTDRGGSSPARGLGPTDGIAAIVPPTDQEITERTKLFDQVSQVFDGRAGWILLADHGSDMGVGNRPRPKDNSLLLVRISISRDGTPFASADVVVVPGQAARSTVPAPSGLQLRYEVVTSEHDPGHLRITAEIERPNNASPRVGTLGGDLRIRMGQIGSLGQVVTTDGTFEFNVGLYRAVVRGTPGTRS